MFTFESFYSRKIDSVISLPVIFLEGREKGCYRAAQGRRMNSWRALDCGGPRWPGGWRLSAVGAGNGGGPSL